MKFAAIYGIFVGIMMFAQWIFFLASGQVPEPQTEPWRIAMHLAAEFAVLLVLVIVSVAVVVRLPKKLGV